MRALVRWGLWRDVLALWVAAVLLGGALAGGSSRAVHAFFSRAVTGLVGAPGEYDAIVHLKREADEGALRALKERLESEYPGYTLKEAPAVAGHRNFLIGLPKARRDRLGLQQLPQALHDIPGFDGITYIIEPAVVIKDVRPELAGELAARAEAAAGVSFSFQSGSSVWAVLRSPADAEPVRRALEGIVGDLLIVEVQLPVAVSGRAEQSLVGGLVKAIEAVEPGLDARPLTGGGGDDETQALLQTAREIIAEFGALDTGELREGLLQLADQLEGALGGAAQQDQAELSYVVDTFRRAVDQVELLEARLAEVTGELKEAAAQGEAADILVALLLQKLLDRLTGDNKISAPAPAVDAGELRAGIDAVEETLRRIDELDLSGTAAALRRLAAQMPALDPGVVEPVLEALDGLAAQSAPSAPRVWLLVKGASAPERVLEAAAGAAGASARVYAQSAGIVQPDARTAVLQLLQGLRRVVTALVALFVLALVLLFDVAVLASFARRLAEVDGTSPRRMGAGLFLSGGLFGAAAFTAAVWLASGAGDVSPGLALGGGVLGALFAWGSERCAPVDREVFSAAMSLGLAEPDILREVVLPAGRPGLLYWLTRPCRTLGAHRLAPV